MSPPITLSTYHPLLCSVPPTLSHNHLSKFSGSKFPFSMFRPIDCISHGACVVPPACRLGTCLPHHSLCRPSYGLHLNSIYLHIPQFTSGLNLHPIYLLTSRFDLPLFRYVVHLHPISTYLYIHIWWYLHPVSIYIRFIMFPRLHPIYVYTRFFYVSIYTHYLLTSH